MKKIRIEIYCQCNIIAGLKVQSESNFIYLCKLENQEDKHE